MSICISEPSFRECFSSIRETCSSNEIQPRIAKTSYIDCERSCREDAECKFFFHIPGKFCLRYPSCNETRVPANIGSTYSKDGVCPGIIFHEKRHFCPMR